MRDVGRGRLRSMKGLSLTAKGVEEEVMAYDYIQVCARSGQTEFRVLVLRTPTGRTLRDPLRQAGKDKAVIIGIGRGPEALAAEEAAGHIRTHLQVGGARPEAPRDDQHMA